VLFVVFEKFIKEKKKLFLRNLLSEKSVNIFDFCTIVLF